MTSKTKKEIADVRIQMMGEILEAFEAETSGLLRVDAARFVAANI
jgi:hypothetical protein